MADVQLKGVEAIKVAYLCKQGSVREVGKAFGELFGHLMRSQAPLAQAPPIGVFYGEAEQFDPENTTYDVCVALAGEMSPSGDVEVKELPAVQVASAVHKGPYDKIGPLYEAMFKWIGERGLRKAGPVREVYLVAPGPGGTSDPEEYVTEAQVPVVQG